jgi:hypothetical protein
MYCVAVCVAILSRCLDKCDKKLKISCNFLETVFLSQLTATNAGRSNPAVPAFLGKLCYAIELTDCTKFLRIEQA